MPKKAVNYASIARKRRAKSKAVNRTSQESVEEAVFDGSFVDKAIEDIQRDGVTEFNQPLRWSPCFEENLRLALDLRIAEVYTSGVAQLQKTLVNSLASSYLAQYAGLRVGWIFPQDNKLDRDVPTQHKPQLEHWSKLAGARVSKSSATSNRLFDVGVGRSIFGALGSRKQSGGADAGLGIVSFTADVAFSEETSQCSWKDLAPLASRVEQSVSPAGPIRYLGTPGGGTGIELQAEHCEFEFWPHTECPSCGEIMNLDSRGALLKEQFFRMPNGQLESRYLTTTGLPIEWMKDENGPYFGCPHCEAEIPDETRLAARFKCVKTGMWLTDMLSDELPSRWRDKPIKCAVWTTPLLRHKTGRVVARTIIENGQNPDSASDWSQQQLGIPSTAMASSITVDHIVRAFETPYFLKGNSVRIMGIDQGRDRWWASLTEVKWDLNNTANGIFNRANYNILEFEGVPWEDCAVLADEWQADCVMLDSKPTIYLAAQFCEMVEGHMAEQQDKLKDDFKFGEARDGGQSWSCWKIQNPKYCRSVIDIFAAGRVHIDEKHRHMLGDNSINSFVRHLKGPSWDSDEGRIERAADHVDDYFFSLVFMLCCFAIYIDNPQAVSRSSGWDWWS